MLDGTYQSTVAAISSQVARGRESLQAARESFTRTTSDLWMADSQLSSADSYVMQAQFDTDSTDSSWMGRAAEGPFHIGQGALLTASFEPPTARATADDASDALSDAAARLQAVAAQLATQGDAFKAASALAFTAAQAAGDGAQDAGDTSKSAGEVDWQLSDGVTQLRLGEDNLSMISQDRPGVCVAPYANAVENGIYVARNDITEAGHLLLTADRSAAQGDDHAAAAQKAIDDLLAELERLPQG